MQLTVTRQDLRIRYAEILAQNPLLARTEGECRSIGWTDEEVRTLQLLLACKSNASLTELVKLLEGGMAKGA